MVEMTDRMSEAAFLDRYSGRSHGHALPRSEHTVDIALFTIRSGALSLLLVRRETSREGQAGHYLVGSSGSAAEVTARGEDLDTAALRELAEGNRARNVPWLSRTAQDLRQSMARPPGSGVLNGLRRNDAGPSRAPRRRRRRGHPLLRDQRP